MKTLEVIKAENPSFDDATAMAVYNAQRNESLKVEWSNGRSLTTVDVFESAPQLPVNVAFPPCKFVLHEAKPIEFELASKPGTWMTIFIIKVELYPKPFGVAINSLLGQANRAGVPLLVDGGLNPDLLIEKISVDEDPKEGKYARLVFP